jgi:hypothetical protein
MASARPGASGVASVLVGFQSEQFFSFAVIFFPWV